MSEMVGQAEEKSQEKAPESETTTVRAYWNDTSRIREIKRKIKVKTQQEVVKRVLDFYEGKIGKEEMADGVHSS